jgi:hypothetical protein
VSILARFSPPGRLPEPNDVDAAAWSARVENIVKPYPEHFPQFYDPTAVDTPDDAAVAPVVWSAFPADLNQEATSEQARWQLADSARTHQDEYCEWGVERNDAGKITQVTFTSEVPEYWEHIAHRDPNRLLSLYHDLVSPEVALEDLIQDRQYVPNNRWNTSTVGRPAHLVQGNNKLGAAIDLAAKATVLRERNGKPVTNQQDLVVCGGFGDPFRNSDPQIGAAVNSAASTGADITLADPLGLYLHGILTAGMVTPDGADPATFWVIERGEPSHALRAHFAVPAGRDYTVSDITVEGRPIQFGAQLADRVQVRLSAVVKPGTHQPKPQPCVNGR